MTDNEKRIARELREAESKFNATEMLKLAEEIKNYPTDKVTAIFINLLRPNTI